MAQGLVNRSLASQASSSLLNGRPHKHAALRCTPAGALAGRRALRPLAASAVLAPPAPSVALASAPLVAVPVAEPRPGAFAERFEMRELLGAGACGSVHACSERCSGEHFAVKVQPKQRNHRTITSDIQHEASFYQKLAGARGMVEIQGVYEDEHNVYIVHELCSGGDLQTLQEQHETFTEYEAAQAMHGVLSFLADCHARNICYGDVKPANFVLKRLWPCVAHLLDPSQPKGELQVRAVDFGCAKEYEEGCSPNTCLQGTPMFMSPELLLGCHGLSVDVWAAGVMMYQLLTDRFPFWDLDMRDLNRLAMHQIKDDIISGDIVFEGSGPTTSLSPEAQSLLHRLLDKDDGRRITAEDALQHPWFKQLGL